jgi:internalin A
LNRSPAQTEISDLTPLKEAGARLTFLNVSSTRVADLAPLQELRVADTPVASPSVLRDLPDLRHFECHQTRVTDPTPLAGLNKLTAVWCDLETEHDREVLRSLPALEQINGKPAAEVLGTAPRR